jgi:hypothetical protein
VDSREQSRRVGVSPAPVTPVRFAQGTIKARYHAKLDGVADHRKNKRDGLRRRLCRAPETRDELPPPRRSSLQLLIGSLSRPMIQGNGYVTGLVIKPMGRLLRCMSLLLAHHDILTFIRMAASGRTGHAHSGLSVANAE